MHKQSSSNIVSNERKLDTFQDNDDEMSIFNKVMRPRNIVAASDLFKRKEPAIQDRIEVQLPRTSFSRMK
jgi:hypothetical protein